MIQQLRENTGGIKGLGKVEKIYLDNTNLVHSLADQTPNVGNLRETFFLNRLRLSHTVTSSSVADFELGDMVFEVGGQNKKQKQIKEVANGYLVKDDLEKGYKNTIPLWQFGMLY